MTNRPDCAIVLLPFRTGLKKLSFPLKRDPADRPSIEAVLAALESAARSSRLSKWRLGAAVALIIATTGAVWLSRERPVPEAALLARPITSYPGHEVVASFSPGGTQIAFAWQRGEHPKFRVYTRALDGGEPKLLTDDGHHPAWSPSGKEIAFLRDVDGDDSIFVVPAEGGPPRAVASTRVSVFTFTPALSWSEDSQWIAYAGVDVDAGLKSIFVVAAASGITHKLRPTTTSSGHRPDNRGRSALCSTTGRFQSTFKERCRD